MKKAKKAKKEYAVYIEHKYGDCIPLQFRLLSSTNVEDAMREAEEVREADERVGDIVYIKLLEAKGDVDVFFSDRGESHKSYKSCERTLYQEILSNSDGKSWHTHEKCGIDKEVVSGCHKYVIPDYHQETVEIKAYRFDRYSWWRGYYGTDFNLTEECRLQLQKGV